MRLRDIEVIFLDSLFLRPLGSGHGTFVFFLIVTIVAVVLVVERTPLTGCSPLCAIVVRGH